ncbi:LysM peptidoglycan-binding domain-containing protein [Xanthomarina spongicola]|uniref:LysM domain-containing protein n=1 Tax=Xanthomarina spongicola TaxID=570520 RepID=A0A316DKI7_9FLAO|nr:LysM peptidoglycan-binding domain-containing protein [Xanthomarina spongicola]PWK18757.1 LysM domain-containing protein [Xanthomarina spongicola]
MKFIINLYVFCLFGSVLGLAQNNPNFHIVTKGENVYRISLKYHVSMNAIFELNPGSDKVILVGQTLKIPNSTKLIQGFQSQNINEYAVIKGDTKYGLSKKYGITINQLESVNPHISNGLQAGHIIKIPKSNNVQDSNTYVVKKGDTKWSLSKSYGISVSQFEKINPNTVPILKAGDVIYTSINNNTTVNITTETELNTDHVDSEVILNVPSNSNKENVSEFIDYIIKPKETLYGLSKRADMTVDEFLNLNPQLSENVLIGTIIKMPNTNKTSTSDIENESEVSNSFPKQNISTQIIWNNDQINTNSQSTFIKNYKIGMQMAIDSIKKVIPNINLNIRDSLDINLLENIDTSNLNTKFIIQPLVSDNNNSNSLSISTLQDGRLKTTNYIGLTEESKLQYGIIKYLNENSGNKILIYDKDKNDTKDFVDSQITNLKTIRINNKGVFNNQELIDYLDPNSKNYVIIESSRDGVYLSTTNILLKQLTNYNIELVVLNAKYIPEEDRVSSKRFRILKLIYPSSFSPLFYNQKNLLLKNNNQNVSKNDSNNIIYGFGMVYHALYQIYFNNYENFKDFNFNPLGIIMEYDDTNLQFSNKTVYIYCYKENSDIFLLKTYK